MVVKRAMRSSTKAARILGEQGGPPEDGPQEPLPCPLCGRPMIPGPSVDEHHLLPRSQGGREKFAVHKICHEKIHRTLKEREIARHYASWDALRTHPEIATFVAWVQKRPPEFM